MGNYNWLVDINMSDKGDLTLTQDGDLDLAYGTKCLTDDVNIRVGSNKGDWHYYPLIGATLEDLIGERNTPAIGTEGQMRIYRALTSDGKVGPQDLNIHIIPTSPNEILYYIVIDCGADGSIQIPYVLKLDA